MSAMSSLRRKLSYEYQSVPAELLARYAEARRVRQNTRRRKRIARMAKPKGSLPK
jgi:hypothetical protein